MNRKNVIYLKVLKKTKLCAEELEKCLDSFQLDDKETNIDKIASATQFFIDIINQRRKTNN